MVRTNLYCIFSPCLRRSFFLLELRGGRFTRIARLLTGRGARANLCSLAFRRALVILIIRRLSVPNATIIRTMFCKCVVGGNFVLLCHASNERFATCRCARTIVPRAFNRLRVVVHTFPTTVNVVRHFRTRVSVGYFSNGVQSFTLRR